MNRIVNQYPANYDVISRQLERAGFPFNRELVGLYEVDRNTLNHWLSNWKSGQTLADSTIQESVLTSETVEIGAERETGK